MLLTLVEVGETSSDAALMIALQSQLHNIISIQTNPLNKFIGLARLTQSFRRIFYCKIYIKLLTLNTIIIF